MRVHAMTARTGTTNCSGTITWLLRAGAGSGLDRQDADPGPRLAARQRAPRL